MCLLVDVYKRQVQTPLNAALTNINTTTQPTLQQYLVNNKGCLLYTSQRRASLEEYRETYLTVPKIRNRKTVFVSEDVRDELDAVVQIGRASCRERVCRYV